MKTFGLPLLLWVAALAGLLLMLLTNGLLEQLGLVLLTTPLLVIARHAWRAQKPQPAVRNSRSGSGVSEE